VPEQVSDEQVLFLSDILPTGYMAAENCHIQPGDTVAVWGCGPVGQFAIQSARWLGAEQVIAIDDVPARLEMARDRAGAETINFARQSVVEALDDMTSGLGPDACIDAVGLEAHGTSPDAIYDRVKHATYLATDRIHVLREAIYCCRKGGTISVPGVYGGLVDKLPFGAAFGKGLTFAMGQTHVHRYMQPLLERILGNGHSTQENGHRTGGNGDITGDEPLSEHETAASDGPWDGFDPTYIISHHLPLDDAPAAYAMFRNSPNECTKIVLKP
jgi:threonine dehydrogenase-like Zn-dependent dehydrogenase